MNTSVLGVTIAPLTFASQSMLDAEAAKVVFTRAMVAHHTCDDSGCLKFVKSLIEMDSVRKNEEVSVGCARACEAK